MPMVISPDSELGKELEKWNTPKRLGGMNTNGDEHYPFMVYKADRYVNGKVFCLHPMAGTGDAVADAFTLRNQRTVKDADEHEAAHRAGWFDSQKEAVEGFEAAAKAEADLAANAAFHAAKMSEKARAEFDAAQDAAEFHDPDPAPPVKKSHHKKPEIKPVEE